MKNSIIGFPRLYAAASLKLPRQFGTDTLHDGFSAALCRGLIEACPGRKCSATGSWRFPRLYAAASLKRVVFYRLVSAIGGFSAALCRGLIEACSLADSHPAPVLFSAALCRGLIEAHPCGELLLILAAVFSAALCRGLIEARRVRLKPINWAGFSAALCRGLIEAWRPPRPTSPPNLGFPRLYAAASLKHGFQGHAAAPPPGVFRGFMPRPH